MSDVIITVRGEHAARILPERAIVHFSISTDGPQRGPVVERIAAITTPVRDDLIARKEAGGVADWTSQRASVWSDRPWTAEGTQLALVHHASVEMTATFSDFAALSWWAGDVIERVGVQFGWIDWQLTPETATRIETEVATDAVQVAVARATAYAAALGLATVSALEVADLGLLSSQPESVSGAARMMKFGSADAAAGGGPALQFQPDELTISAAVEARFGAR